MKIKKDLARRLVAAQADLASVTRDSAGSTGGRTYNYASLSSVMEAVRGPLQEQGLFITHRVVTDLDTCQVKVWTSVVSLKGDAVEVKIVLPFPGDATNLAQAIGSAHTYARRYGVLLLLGLATADDDGAMLARSTGPTGRVSMNPYGDDEQQRLAAAEANREPREDGRDLVSLETWDELIEAGRSLNEAQRGAMQEWRESLDEPFGFAVSAQETIEEALRMVRQLIGNSSTVIDEAEEESPADLKKAADDLAVALILEAAEDEETLVEADQATEEPSEPEASAEEISEPAPEEQAPPKRGTRNRGK